LRKLITWALMQPRPLAKLRSNGALDSRAPRGDQIREIPSLIMTERPEMAAPYRFAQSGR
jgi:hypothetical protein